MSFAETMLDLVKTDSRSRTPSFHGRAALSPLPKLRVALSPLPRSNVALSPLPSRYMTVSPLPDRPSVVSPTQIYLSPGFTPRQSAINTPSHSGRATPGIPTIQVDGAVLKSLRASPIEGPSAAGVIDLWKRKGPINGRLRPLLTRAHSRRRQKSAVPGSRGKEDTDLAGAVGQFIQTSRLIRKLRGGHYSSQKIDIEKQRRNSKYWDLTVKSLFKFTPVFY